MADWRKLAVDLVLADNAIDENEVKILKKHLYEDGKIDKKEVEFLVELRNLGQKKVKGQALSPAFEKFFFKAFEDYVLADGQISNAERIDPKVLHLSGEFAEQNLGTTVGADGSVTVRAIATQFMFVPRCIAVPQGRPVTLRLS